MRRSLQRLRKEGSYAVTIACEGGLSCLAADRVDRTMRQLPADVRRAHLDLSGLRLYDVDAMEAIVATVRRWACARTGHVAISPPSTPSCGLGQPR